MPTYTAIVELSITFPGGAARGHGNGRSPTLGQSTGGAGLELQVVTVYFKKPVANAFACYQAMHTAYKRALQIAAQPNYNWNLQGVQIITIGCTIVNVQ